MSYGGASIFWVPEEPRWSHLTMSATECDNPIAQGLEDGSVPSCNSQMASMARARTV